MRGLALLLVFAVLATGCGDAAATASAAPSAVSSPAPAAASPSPHPTPSPAPTPSPSPKPVADLIARIDQAKLDAHLKALTDVVSRDVHHPGHAKAVAYIKQELAKLSGVQVTSQRTSYQGIPLENIFAVIEPLEFNGRANGEGIICAHYDSIANRSPGWRPALDPAPGADDNATGTAALLEYARILAADRGSFRQTIRLAFFDGEELFFKGSAAYLTSLGPPPPFSWVINIDMVGFNPIADRLDLIYYTARSAGLRDGMKAANDRYQIGVSPLVEQLATSGATILDAAPFGLAGIPAIAVVQRYGENDATFPGNYTFHTMNDTPDKVGNKRLWMKAAKLTLATALELARGETAP